ncbi:MAG: MarR family transcriptional regulator [Eubacteriaceae bacterium]|nr:MarR family transcriptional regulator [Eubacteriaceae bacterium]
MDSINVLESLNRLVRLTRRFQVSQSRDARGPGHASFGDTRLMGVLHRSEGLSAKELAEIMDVRPPSLSEALGRLESNGDIRRERDALDYRVNRFYLTDKGRNEIQKRADDYTKMRDAIEECLSEEERGIFIKLCGKLSNQLTELTEKGNPRRPGYTLGTME